MLGTNLKNSAGDAWDVWTSPLRGHPTDWLYAAGIVAGGALISPADAAVDRWAFKQRDDGTWSALKPFREGGIAFSGKTITPIALSALLVAVVTRNDRLQQGLLGCATAYAASSAVRTFVYYPLVARTRPDSSHDIEQPPAQNGDQYDIDVPGSSSWGRHSFPGGHVANVAACTGFLTRRYSMGIAEVLPWAVVGGVGVGRILDRRHWLSDQALGIAFGYAVGKQVAVRSSHRANRSKTNDKAIQRRSSFAIEPDDGGFRLRRSTIF
jgi:membrane-associated phospholipid phosphatase